MARELSPDQRVLFDQVWQPYPCKKAKKDALKAWGKLSPAPDQALVERMIDNIALQCRSKQWRDGFIPYFSTFLRGERWEDELTGQDFYQARL